MGSGTPSVMNLSAYRETFSSRSVERVVPSQLQVAIGMRPDGNEHNGALTTEP